MTRDNMRPAAGSSHGFESTDDLDLLGGLWEEAPFVRLPCDAPSELRDLAENIDNPKRVYAVHKASRRHNFQQLVQRYVVQLRDGCGSEHCTTPTCFTSRRRALGHAPIRRYSPTSARTLATYLATQDNPESGLCPALKTPRGPPAAVNSLVFVPTSKPRSHGERAALGPPRMRTANSRPTSLDANGTGDLASSHVQPNNITTGGSIGREDGLQSCSAKSDSDQKSSRQPEFEIIEEPVTKDHRSFAANVFGTVAFKMLEWLTPAALEHMHQKTKEFQGGFDTDHRDSGPTKVECSHAGEGEARSKVSTTPSQGASVNGQPPTKHGQAEHATHKDDPQPRELPSTSRSGTPRRNSNAKVRTASGPKPKRQMSVDPYSQDNIIDEPYPGLLKSPRGTGGPTDKGPRGLKSTPSSLTRPISQLSSAGYFDDVTLEKMPPPKAVDLKHRVGRGQLDGVRGSNPASPKENGVASGVSERSYSSGSVGAATPDSDSEDESILPQSLSRLSAEVVDFICDVMQENGTTEFHMLQPPVVTKFHNGYSGHGKTLRRKKHTARPVSPNLRLEWKLFVEQTLFYVLSDPHLAARSFTKKGQFYDSQTLWYCMLRLTRVDPDLVFHSLWMAAGSLFAPPKSLLAPRSPTAKLFKNGESLSNLEAGRLMSVCLHALIAAAPLVKESRQLYDLSRIRSHGLSLAGSGAIAQQPVELCLQYEDVFTDSLALRLARRLFSAIITRRYFDELSESSDPFVDHTETDVLAPLFSQLDFLNMDAVYVLDFSFPDRALHETRVPILLLDWARAVMLSDWDGRAEVPGDGPFGGALALIESMYKKRNELLLGDAQFRAEYFAERLDTVRMPIAWLSHNSTRQSVHLLDYPYIFNPATLVSYFRSINFSRMSRCYEESTSIQERIDVIASRSSLTQHHKEVLTERLRSAATKYLILDISRESVIQDAFDQLWRREERELLKPLKVHLGESTGEEGFDSGGVQQEFFRMAIAEALNPDYGAFTVDERNRMTWFLPGSLEDEWKFELIGLLVSLAVYNGLTLPVTFPKALYRKLLGEPVTELHHIADGWPDLANGLTKLLEWDEKNGAVEDVFARTYEFSVSALGQHVTREMKPAETGLSDEEEWPQFAKTAGRAFSAPAPHDGNPAEDEAPLVTSANRNAYVSDYIRYLTDVSVRPQFEAFARGFRACLHPKSLSLLTPNLLQSVVEGVQEIDILELKRYARYVGWDASHRTIKDFWSIVKRYDDNMKRKLLEFVTASDRVPVGGVKNMMFILQRNGEEEDPHGRLPTSYTCYGTLLLPEYKDKETLKERLGMALENARGFGFA
ncbi:hypothetical protein QBC35DRAFT_529601 [Podospora australis]|uniref:HECT-type E3 ubiquitin transferase n=1 Tax=Podospora australis TaxID=1536484 RepID=A0AAN6WYZ5_9PEZI|nr:hypothetical protein QBC35DRAFT_529601 [Podospora australis]